MQSWSRELRTFSRHFWSLTSVWQWVACPSWIRGESSIVCTWSISNSNLNSKLNSDPGSYFNMPACDFNLASATSRFIISFLDYFGKFSYEMHQFRSVVVFRWWTVSVAIGTQKNEISEPKQHDHFHSQIIRARAKRLETPFFWWEIWREILAGNLGGFF